MAGVVTGAPSTQGLRLRVVRMRFVRWARWSGSGRGDAQRYRPVPPSNRVAATAWTSRSRRITYSSPCTSTSNRSSGLNRTLSPTLTERTCGPTATVFAHARRRDTWAVAGIRMPARDRRSPSDWPTWTRTRSAHTLIANGEPSLSAPVAGAAEVVVATSAGYRSPGGARTGQPQLRQGEPRCSAARSGRTDGDAGRRQVGLGLRHGELTEVEDRRGQHGVGRTLHRPLDEVVQLTHPAGGH